MGLRINRVGVGQLAGRAFEGGREEQGLAAVVNLPDDPVHRRLESHVEHAVGFVQDQVPDVVEVEGTPLDLILEPAGAGDDDVRFRSALCLLLQADPAVDGGDPESAGMADPFHLVDDLARQLTCGSQDQSGRAGILGLDEIDQRHTEGQGLARAGRGLDQHVVALEDVLDDLTLDGKRGFDAAFA